jgi:hypothetical protein
MIIETPRGLDHTAADCQGGCEKSDFAKLVPSIRLDRIR